MKLFLKTSLAVGVLFIAVVIAQIFLASAAKEDPMADEHFQKHFNSNYKIYALTHPVGISFAGEVAPLELLDVREKLDRELLVNTYWQSQSMLFHKRANRYFPIIEPLLKEQGVPEDFKYLCVVESGMQNVVSPAGATGFWQFMEDTGREFGLEIGGEIDERYNIEKATVAACGYLKQAYDRYGNWTMAAASYNLGMNGLDRQIERQKATNYYDLLLVEETARYLFRILAVKEILEHPQQYGFHFREKDLYPPIETKTVVVDSAVADFADFAFQHDVNYKILKILNPWLRDTYLKNPRGKRYAIKLPVDGAAIGLLPADPPSAKTDTLQTDSVSR